MSIRRGILRRIRLLCLLVLTMSSVSACAEPKAAAKASAACFPLLAFYPTWRVTAHPIETIDWTRQDGLAVGFALPTAEGGLDISQMEAFLPELVTAAHANGNQVYVSIGGALGYADAFQVIGKDSAKRAAFAKAVADFAATYQVDGIDIDWEFWTWQHIEGRGGRDPVESPLLGALLKDVRAALPPQVKLSVDVFAGEWTGAQYTPDIQDHVDHINLMAYDFTGAWESSAVAHHADIPTMLRALDLLQKRGFDPAKTMLGLPAYGVEFPDGKPLSAKQVPYADIVERTRDKPKAFAAGRDGTLFFDRPKDTRRKIDIALEKGLAGAFFWELTSDTTAADTSLVTAAYQQIGARSCRVPKP